jgi:hypothetical protein
VAALLVGGAVLGVGPALALTAMANLIVAAAPQRDVGIATGMNAVMRTIGWRSARRCRLRSWRAPRRPEPLFASEHGYVVAFAVAACATAAPSHAPSLCRAEPAAWSRLTVRSPHTRVDFSSNPG